MWPMLRRLAFFVLLGCGSTTSTPTGAPESPPSATLPPLPRSSIAAVLLHRDELKLSDEQVKGLQEIDEELADREKALTERHEAGPPRPDAGTAGGSSRLHMMSGRGSGGGMHRPRPSGGSPARAGRPLQERIDDLDTRAYLKAESDVLAPEQRDRARDIAEKYREDLYDRRNKEDDSER